MIEPAVITNDGSATETVYTGKAKVYGITLTPAAAVSTIVVRDGGGSGAVKRRVQAPANGESVHITFPAPLTFNTDIHVTLTGAGAFYHIDYRPIRSA